MLLLCLPPGRTALRMLLRGLAVPQRAAIFTLLAARHATDATAVQTLLLGPGPRTGAGAGVGVRAGLGSTAGAGAGSGLGSNAGAGAPQPAVSGLGTGLESGAGAGLETVLALVVASCAADPMAASSQQGLRLCAMFPAGV